MKIAAQEAEDCKKAVSCGDKASYFRTLSRTPKDFGRGSRVFYVEDGYIRGFAVVEKVRYGGIQCETTNRWWTGSCYAVMPAQTWTWIKPIPMKGFQGWRYFKAPEDMQIVGGWWDQKPSVG